MAKKDRGTKNNPAEILDDNGTLIAALAGEPGPIAPDAGEGGPKPDAKPGNRRPPGHK